MILNDFYIVKVLRALDNFIPMVFDIQLIVKLLNQGSIRLEIDWIGERKDRVHKRYDAVKHWVLSGLYRFR